jgi:dTDP-4-dehydrorhamnose 3,5-epimerase
MRFEELPLAGTFVVSPERHRDARGWLARTFCRDEFAARGLVADFVQCSTSFNARSGTLRGMHFQRAPHAETKLVRCTRGAVFDVLLDLRPDSATFRCWHAVELSEANGVAAYIPAGLAHGFQSLTDASEVLYQITERYAPEASAGVRWDDPAFGIDWPILPPIMADRDAGYADYREVAAHE